MRSQKELYEYEIGVERRALADNPEDERLELKALFLGRGIDEELAERLSIDLMKNPDLALRTHAREELGIDPSATGSPWAAAISSFLFFSVGALLPLVPWIVTSTRQRDVVVDRRWPASSTLGWGRGGSLHPPRHRCTRRYGRSSSWRSPRPSPSASVTPWAWVSRA